MAVPQKRPKRKASGGRYVPYRSKRLSELATLPTLTRIGERSVKVNRVRGSASKRRLVSGDMINVFDPKTKKCFVVKIETLKESPADRNFVRRNILTKGGVVQTPKGDVRITSRPGQDGVLNGVLLHK